jgi:hypothetical protein
LAQITLTKFKLPDPADTVMLFTSTDAHVTVRDDAVSVVIAIVAVPFVKVKLVAVDVSHTVPVPVRVHVPDPIASVLAPVPEQLNVAIVGLLLFVAKVRVPVKAPIVTEVTLKFTLTVTVPPPEDPSKVTVSPAPGTD